jgi:hypothetical protein
MQADEKQKNATFLRGSQFNHATLFTEQRRHTHCSLNNGGMCPLLSEQGRHTHCSPNNGAYKQCKLHCSREILFFFFSVLIF